MTPESLAGAHDVRDSPSAVEMESGTKVFTKEDGTSVTAFARVDLSVQPGEFLCVLGPSGCGKTTMLRCLAGLETLTDGSITISGESVSGVHRDIAMVFQRAVLLPWLTVAGNIGLPLRIGGYDRRCTKADAEERVRVLLDLVGLAGFGTAYPYELSGGMQQRASIARALARDPAILMMDEPFGALDALTRQNMNFELVNIWRRSGKTIVLITHSIQEALILADRVVVMSERPGRIVEELRIDLPRPRVATALKDGSETYLGLVRRIEEALGVAH
jgi:NitT/TauT family transport system ATP-binding protein